MGWSDTHLIFNVTADYSGVVTFPFCPLLPSSLFTTSSFLPAALLNTGQDFRRNTLFPPTSFLNFRAQDFLTLFAQSPSRRMWTAARSSPAVIFIPFSRSRTNAVSGRDPSLAPREISLHCEVWQYTHLRSLSFNPLFTHASHDGLFLDTPCWNLSERSTRQLYCITPAVCSQTPSKYQWNHVAQFWSTKAMLALPQHVISIYIST